MHGMYCAGNTIADMFDVVLTRDAQIDLDEIFVWYEEQKEGLGFDFVSRFELILQKLSGNPYYASFILDDARGVSIKKFPYEIIYRVNNAKQQVRIIAIIHQHRNPEWFRIRIR